MGLSHSPLMTVCKDTAAVQFSSKAQKLAVWPSPRAHPLPVWVMWWLYYLWSLLLALLGFGRHDRERL
jgi:hypothetical protein